jgi:sulfatase maturation enzyme AslB (radical SAM superfamily)
MMDGTASVVDPPLDPAKFQDPERTVAGEVRGAVRLDRLATLWFNTGTLCNITCRDCYIDSSPRNDRLVYITVEEVTCYLDEISDSGLNTTEIGLTGGEPFMNPDIIRIMETALRRGFRVLVLTNAMRPMQRHEKALLDLKSRFGDKLAIRVSVDHYSKALHEEERGDGSWEPMLKGLTWLAQAGVLLDVAGRTRWNEDDTRLRDGYAAFFTEHDIPIDARDPARLVLFPEMDATRDVPEITEHCWSILSVDPGDMMCATSRMVVKRKGADGPSVVACTLLPYDTKFDLGPTLADASDLVQLNHPHCARFCVLGGGACSVG